MWRRKYQTVRLATYVGSEFPAIGRPSHLVQRVGQWAAVALLIGWAAWRWLGG